MFSFSDREKREQIEDPFAGRGTARDDLESLCMVVQGVHDPRIPGQGKGVEAGIQPFYSPTLYVAQRYICQEKEAPLFNYH